MSTRPSRLMRPGNHSPARHTQPPNPVKRKKSTPQAASDCSDLDPDRPPESASDSDNDVSLQPESKRRRPPSPSGNPGRSADIRSTKFTLSKSYAKTSKDSPSTTHRSILSNMRESSRSQYGSNRVRNNLASRVYGASKKAQHDNKTKSRDDENISLIVPPEISPARAVPKPKPKPKDESPKLELFEIDMPLLPKLPTAGASIKSKVTNENTQGRQEKSNVLSKSTRSTYSKKEFLKPTMQAATLIIPPHRRRQKEEPPKKRSSSPPQANLAELLPAGLFDNEFLPLPEISEEVKNWKKERQAEEEAAKSPKKVSFGKIGDVDIDELVREAADERADEKKPTIKMVKCTTCNRMVLSSRLESFSEGKPLPVRRMVDFCEIHTRQDAEEAWKKQNLPEIDWDGLSVRVGRFKDTLVDVILCKRPSEFRDKLAKNIQAPRKLNIATERPPLGYYGVRGMYSVQECIYNLLGKMIQQQALADKVISSRGWMFFTESVLVPETIVCLIMEDNDMGEVEARDYLKSTTWIGDALSHEVQETVETQHHDLAMDGSQGSYGSDEKDEDDIYHDESEDGAEDFLSSDSCADFDDSDED
ncbi:hypothetical protein BROUX41_001422 [Berkeleyomyces rouxiae]|uniref:uncharacterized protein n=1 Tax=Berkeleyomyces rouxiae TaxID=2035830 RepID=UPI003B7A1131